MISVSPDLAFLAGVVCGLLAFVVVFTAAPINIGTKYYFDSRSPFTRVTGVAVTVGVLWRTLRWEYEPLNGNTLWLLAHASREPMRVLVEMDGGHREISVSYTPAKEVAP